MGESMREPTFLILSALADQPRHGYAIMAETAILSDGAVKLQAGTLYAALERLTAEGLVAIAHEEVVDGRHRRYLSLTDLGRAALRTEAEQRRRVAERALRRLSGPTSAVTS
jgi:PadR family transcriptional regulator, regulatory protein PadR